MSTTTQAQLIINIEDVTVVKDLKKILKRIDGIGQVTLKKPKKTPEEETLEAIKKSRKGEDLYQCSSFEDFKRQMNEI